MPPRRSSHLKHVPLQHASVTESMEAKLKRLRLTVAEERSEAPAASPCGPDGTQAASGSATKPPVQNTFTRSDAPVIRNVRRGSATESISSYHSAGESALVEELIQDRAAKSSYASATSLLGTWHRFHHEAFDTPAVASSAIPVTIRSIIVVGALFKRGGTGHSRTTSQRAKVSISKPASTGRSCTRILQDG